MAGFGFSTARDDLGLYPMKGTVIPPSTARSDRLASCKSGLGQTFDIHEPLPQNLIAVEVDSETGAMTEKKMAHLSQEALNEMRGAAAKKEVIGYEEAIRRADAKKRGEASAEGEDEEVEESAPKTRRRRRRAVIPANTVETSHVKVAASESKQKLVRFATSLGSIAMRFDMAFVSEGNLILVQEQEPFNVPPESLEEAMDITVEGKDAVARRCLGGISYRMPSGPKHTVYFVEEDDGEAK